MDQKQDGVEGLEVKCIDRGGSMQPDNDHFTAKIRSYNTERQQKSKSV